MTFCEVKPFLQLDQNDVSDKSPPKSQSLSLELSSTRSLGALRLPSGLLDNVLHALQGAQAVWPTQQCNDGIFFIHAQSFFRSFWHQRIYDSSLGSRDPLHTNFCDEDEDRGIVYSSSWIGSSKVHQTFGQ